MIDVAEFTATAREMVRANDIERLVADYGTERTPVAA